MNLFKKPIKQITPPTGKNLPIRHVMMGFGAKSVVMQGFGAMNETLYLPPDNVEWMVAEYQNLSPEPSITDIGADASMAPSFVSDPINNSVVPVVGPTQQPVSNVKKVAVIGAGLTALLFAMK